MLYTLTAVLHFLSPILTFPSDHQIINEIKKTIYYSVKYLDENISVEGGYVWYYKKDLTRRWGELEAYPSMIWVQGAGTVAMGHLFLDAYESTKDEYYYELAKKSAHALIKGQLDCGGWNYLIDFAGEKSLKKWYSTIGANGGRLEEFHHYYGNATFDDDVTAGASKLLLRLFLVKKDSIVKKALDKAIKFILNSQFPNGAWPQRYPFKEEFNKNRKPDYTLYYTFNDNVIWNNIKFLILCYAVLKNDSLLISIKKGMNFYLLSQYQNPQAGWAQQYNHNLEPAKARTYEPAALDPQYTAKYIEILIKFYEMTGDKKFLQRIPDAINWLSTVAIEKRDSIIVVPKFVELNTNKPLFIHRKGTNKYFGKYFIDYENKNTIVHYSCIRFVNIKPILRHYEDVVNNNIYHKHVIEIPIKENGLNTFNEVEEYLKLSDEKFFSTSRMEVSLNKVEELISKGKNNQLWLSKDVFISNPYIDEKVTGDSSSLNYCCSYVGDKFDTSTYPNQTDEEFISIREFIRNVKYLLNCLKKELNKKDDNND